MLRLFLANFHPRQKINMAATNAGATLKTACSLAEVLPLMAFAALRSNRLPSCDLHCRQMHFASTLIMRIIDGLMFCNAALSKSVQLLGSELTALVSFFFTPTHGFARFIQDWLCCQSALQGTFACAPVDADKRCVLSKFPSSSGSHPGGTVLSVTHFESSRDSPSAPITNPCWAMASGFGLRKLTFVALLSV